MYCVYYMQLSCIILKDYILYKPYFVFEIKFVVVIMNKSFEILLK